jgi:tetratricopeptide (TPR) repeat protein
MKSSQTFLATGFWGLVLLAAAASRAPAQDSRIRGILEEADRSYARRSEAGWAERAVAAYKKALALDSSSSEGYWKMARVLYWIGTHEPDAEKKTAVHKDAIGYAKLAVAADETSVPAHFWLGVHFGLYGEAKGIGQSLYLVDFIKKEMEWVLAKDEGFMTGAAYRVLGRVYFRLPGIQGGDNDKAVELLRKSLTFKPFNPMSRNYLADVYLAQGKKFEALEELRQALSDPVDPEYEPEFKEERETAKRRLRELGE